MRRPPVLGVLIVLIGLILAACASPSGDGGEPSSAAGSEAPGASQGGGDSGNGGNGEAPQPAEGVWSAGEAEVTVSGDASASLTGQISPPSGTYDGATSLIYVSEDGSLTVGINAEEAFGVAVTTSEFVAGGGANQDCEVDYRQADDSRIEATFRCDNADAIGINGVMVGTVTLEGSFTATR